MKDNLSVFSVPMNTINEYEGNARISDNTVTQLASDIEKYGFNSPIVLNKDKTIINGHSRYRALKKLGWKDAPCVIVDMSDYTSREYRIMDNKIQELSEWDNDKLLIELRAFDTLEDIQEEFGEKIESAFNSNMTYQKTEQGTIDKMTENAEHHFENVTKRRQDNVNYCTCENCGEEFGYR